MNLLQCPAVKKEVGMVDTIKITTPLWSGYQRFNYKRRQPFVGIAAHKLQQAEDKVEIALDYLRDRPKVAKDPKELIALAKANGWEGYNRSLKCYYYPQEVLLGGGI